MVVCISVGLVVISLYHFLLHLFDSSLFSPLLLWLAVYFVDLFKETAPGFIDFFEGIFFVSISFSSALILVISCLLLAFEFFDLATSVLLIVILGYQLRSFLISCGHLVV